MTVPMFFDAFYFKVQVAATYQRQGGNIATLFGSVKRCLKNNLSTRQGTGTRNVKYKCEFLFPA
jgi:hypothetical protein